MHQELMTYICFKCLRVNLLVFLCPDNIHPTVANILTLLLFLIHNNSGFCEGLYSAVGWHLMPLERTMLLMMAA